MSGNTHMLVYKFIYHHLCIYFCIHSSAAVPRSEEVPNRIGGCWSCLVTSSPVGDWRYGDFQLGKGGYPKLWMVFVRKIGSINGMMNRGKLPWLWKPPWLLLIQHPLHEAQWMNFCWSIDQSLSGTILRVILPISLASFLTPVTNQLRSGIPNSKTQKSKPLHIRPKISLIHVGIFQDVPRKGPLFPLNKICRQKRGPLLAHVHGLQLVPLLMTELVGFPYGGAQNSIGFSASHHIFRMVPFENGWVFRSPYETAIPCLGLRKVGHVFDISIQLH